MENQLPGYPSRGVCGWCWWCVKLIYLKAWPRLRLWTCVLCTGPSHSFNRKLNLSDLNFSISSAIPNCNREGQVQDTQSSTNKFVAKLQESNWVCNLGKECRTENKNLVTLSVATANFGYFLIMLNWLSLYKLGVYMVFDSESSKDRGS